MVFTRIDGSGTGRLDQSEKTTRKEEYLGRKELI
jgi:hypothetical protein